jgi:hypothetical protein
MESADNSWAALLCHPSTPSDATHGIEARVYVGESGAIEFRYVLRGEIARLRVPPTGREARADRLWEHTCFEAFIMAPGRAGYYELNFAPSLQWAAYRFNTYRERNPSAHLDAPPEIAVRRFDDRLEVDASVSLHELSGLRGESHLLLALSAVVEAQNGTLSYWALKHAPGKPDFHHRDGFVLELQGLS